jgi:hypothetical protein
MSINSGLTLTDLDFGEKQSRCDGQVKSSNPLCLGEIGYATEGLFIELIALVLHCQLPYLFCPLVSKSTVLRFVKFFENSFELCEY